MLEDTVEQDSGTQLQRQRRGLSSQQAFQQDFKLTSQDSGWDREESILDTDPEPTHTSRAFNLLPPSLSRNNKFNKKQYRADIRN